MFSSAAEVSKQKPKAVLTKRGETNVFSLIVPMCRLIFWNDKNLKSLYAEPAPLKTKPAPVIKGKRTLINIYVRF